MPFAAAHSKQADLPAVLPDLCSEVREALQDRSPDLVLAFVSLHHSRHFDRLAEMIQQQFGGGVLLGCTGETVIGGSEEIEEGPAVSIWAAVLPETELTTFRLDFSQTPDGVMCSGLPLDLAERRERARAVLLLGEPYSSVPNSMLDQLSDELPGVPVVGGMASGASVPGDNRLFLDAAPVGRGAAGVLIQGAAPIRTLVSQGCRPIGSPYVVTRAEQNIVFELGGSSPMERLQELIPTLTQRDQALVQRGLHLGIAMNEYQDHFECGDFLISNVVGADRDSGAVAIANPVRTGQTIQFHVRDAATADEELLQLLESHRQRHGAPRAGLLFSCNGRGTRLFPEPNHDAARIQEQLGPIPLAGIFAQGEIGPVGGRNYVHGFTASLALFE